VYRQEILARVYSVKYSTNEKENIKERRLKIPIHNIELGKHFQ